MISQEQRNREGRKPAVFPLPKFHSLCCPHCNKYKMRLSPVLQAYLCLGGDECGKMISFLEAESFIGLEMVEG